MTGNRQDPAGYRGAAPPRRAGRAVTAGQAPFDAMVGDDDPDAPIDAAGPRGLYDPDPDGGDDPPWFAPHEADDPDHPDGGAGMPAWAQPGPRADPRPDAAAGDWAAAESHCAAALARAALAVGALDDRVRSAAKHGAPVSTGTSAGAVSAAFAGAGAGGRTGPRAATARGPDRPDTAATPDPAHPGAGLRRRLLCAEIADLAWHLGDRVTVDRLALYLVLRLPGMGAHAAEEAQALARAAWAWRRLDHGAAPPLDDAPALAAWLGRAATSTADGPDPALIGRPMGTEFDALAQDWARGVAAEGDRHPFVQAAAAWQGWRARGLSGDIAEIEGAVLSARIAALALRPGGLGFVPLGLGGGGALRAGGDTGARLHAWLAGIEAAALRGLMDCDRLAAWTAQARDLTAPMSGRTPGRLIDALAAWPIVSAPMLAAQTGASRAAVQRNMIRFEDLGLVRELTGQARFRFWRAAL